MKCKEVEGRKTVEEHYCVGEVVQNINRLNNFWRDRSLLITIIARRFQSRNACSMFVPFMSPEL